MDVRSLIWTKFRIKRGDNLPYYPWLNCTRNDIAELFAEAGFTRGAEIGVRKGEFSEVLLRSNPNLTLLCVDTWAPYGRVGQGRQDAFLHLCRRRLVSYKHEIMKMSSMEALNHVPDASLDFVYVDGLHDFDNMMMDTICWSKKVREGGIVSGHDFYNFYRGGITFAVEAYTRAHALEWYLTREIPASWFWVR